MSNLRIDRWKMEFPKKLGGFELTGELGAGAMGTVYRAVQSNLGRQVVIKTLHPHLAKNEDLIKRFQREAKSAATLQHPNTVQVIEYGQESGMYFIAMEYVDGLDLKDILKEMGAFPPEIALIVLRDVCRGMEAAHGRGIIHRDLKPANLMITARGQVKVMDFGLAREAVDSTELTAHGSILGTAAYMAPEQARGETERLNHRADIFSTGLVGYEIAAGRRAIQGETTVAVFAAVLDGKIDPLDSVVSGLPEGYAELIHWMTHKDLEERCPTMTTARDRLEEMVEAAGIRRAERYLADFVNEARERIGRQQGPAPVATNPPVDETRIAGSSERDASGPTPPVTASVVDTGAGTMVAGGPENVQSSEGDSIESGSSGTSSIAGGTHGGSGEDPSTEPTRSADTSGTSAPPNSQDPPGSARRWAVIVPILILTIVAGVWRSGILKPDGGGDDSVIKVDTTDFKRDSSSVPDPELPDTSSTDRDPEQEPDPVVIPLAAVADLQAAESTHSSIRLSWTVPPTGDIPGSSVATTTRIRFSRTRIDSTNWATAESVPGAPAPTPGRGQSYVVSGLDPDSRYFFGLRTEDTEGSVSPLSNVLATKTKATPPPEPPIILFKRKFSVSTNPYAPILKLGGVLIENPEQKMRLSLTLREGTQVFRAINEGMNLDRTFRVKVEKNDPDNTIVLDLFTGKFDKRFEESNQ